MTDQKMAVRAPRRAIALPAVLLLVFVGLGIALSIHRYSTETYRRTSRGVYATMSEVMAESAAEEAWYSVQRDVNTPGSELYRLFRLETGFENFEVNLPILRGKLNDAQFGGYIAERYDPNGIKAFATMTWGSPYGNAVQGIGDDGEFDNAAPWERFGTLTIVGQAQAKARIEGLANFRRMIVKRGFRIVKPTPPVPFDRSGLIVLYPSHMNDTLVAGLSDLPTNFDQLRGGRNEINPLLNKANTLIGDASKHAKEFNDAYKGCLDGFGNHVTPPPQWLQKIIDELNGKLVSAGTMIDVNGNGRRPFMSADSVIIARTTMSNGFLGDLKDFNYSKNIKDELKPLNDVLDAISQIQKINVGIIKALEYPHKLVPYGAGLAVITGPMMVIIPECVPSVRSICEGLHDNLMDPVLEICNGVGQVLALVQKVLIEVPMMGQQAFAGFQQQIAGAAGGAIQTQIGNLNLNNDALQGLPTNTAAMGFSLNMPLPNYTTGDESKQQKDIDSADLAKRAGEAFMGVLIGLVERQLVTYVTTQITMLTGQVTASIAATAAACSAGSIFTFGGACVAAKGIAFGIFTGITRAVNSAIQRQLSRISSLKGNGLGALTRVLTQQIPALNKNPIIGEALGTLLGRVVNAAFDRRDISGEVDTFVQEMATKISGQVMQEIQSGTGLDKVGGVLKGYALRHRFRNLVEFDGSSAMSAFGENGATPGTGTDGLNAWRSAFDRVYRPSLWRKKATWIVKNKAEFDALVSRYCKGVFAGRPGDPSGDGTNRWRGDSFSPNAPTPEDRYGLSGIIFYDGPETDPIEINFPSGSDAFKGKCTIYSPEASIKVTACRMRDPAKDHLTIISGKPIELPPAEVEISAHAIGNNEDCKVQMKGATITGNLVLKTYRFKDQEDPKAQLDGKLTFKEVINGTGGPAIGGMKESHLFVTISPYVLSREMETAP